VPTVGYRSAGGLRESVLDGRSGVLVDDLDEMTEAVDRLLDDESRRLAMGEAAARHAASFNWAASIRGFAGVLRAAAQDSAAVAVHQDVDRLVGLLALLDGGGVGVDGGGDAGDRDGPDGGATREGQEHGQEGLHRETHFRRDRRRSVTVEGDLVIHNSAPVTTSSQPA
jgi:hypothetical protein